jgi:hypothetical protein
MVSPPTGSALRDGGIGLGASDVKGQASEIEDRNRIEVVIVWAAHAGYPPNMQLPLIMPRSALVRQM